MPLRPPVCVCVCVFVCVCVCVCVFRKIGRSLNNLKSLTGLRRRLRSAISRYLIYRLCAGIQLVQLLKLACCSSVHIAVRRYIAATS